MHVVRGDEHALALLARHLDDFVLYGAAALHVEAGGRFIQQQYLRIGDERDAYGQLLALTPRQVPHLHVGLFFQADEAEEFFCAFAKNAAFHVFQVAVVGEVLEGRERPIAGARALEHHAYLLENPAAVALDVEPVDQHPAAVRLHQAANHFHGRGFARAVRAQQAKNFTPRDSDAYFSGGVRLLRFIEAPLAGFLVDLQDVPGDERLIDGIQFYNGIQRHLASLRVFEGVGPFDCFNRLDVAAQFVQLAAVFEKDDFQIAHRVQRGHEQEAVRRIV